jgi:adenosylmethionine-8-amino-7-oxononanoate aminotransferase
MTIAERTTTTTEDDEIASYIERGLEHLWVHTQQVTDLAKEDGLKVFERGEGIYLWDIKGRRFIDAMSGLWVVNAGHGRAELAEVAAKQMREMAYVNTFAYTSRPAVDLATKLASLLPPSLNKLFFVNSGSEAVETAIRMAKHYQYNVGEKKRYKVLARRGSYHGMTAGALSVNGSPALNKAPWEPLLPGVVFVENVNCYRCPFEKTYPACDTFCARTIERTIQAERAETIAAFIAEPLSAANAGYPPPDDYWPTIRRLCDKYGILLIADEVINGFGRTGRWFASELFNFEPDLMTMAKGLSSGYLPIAAVGVSDKVAREFEGDKSKTFGGGITFGTHPVSCAVALANINIIEREGLVENAARNGAYLHSRLNSLKENHPIVGEVRGRGLLLAVEIVKDPVSKELFPEADDLPGKLTAALVRNGIICRAGNILNIAPPLVITEAECDDLAARIDAALTETEQALGLG